MMGALVALVGTRPRTLTRFCGIEMAIWERSGRTVAVSICSEGNPFVASKSVGNRLEYFYEGGDITECADRIRRAI